MLVYNTSNLLNTKFSLFSLPEKFSILSLESKMELTTSFGIISLFDNFNFLKEKLNISDKIKGRNLNRSFNIKLLKIIFLYRSKSSKH